MRHIYENLLLLSVFFLLGSTILINPSFQQSEPVIIVSPSKTELYTPALGITFLISVNVIRVFNLTGFEFRLNWNTTLLDLAKVDIKQFLNTPLNVNANETNEALGQYHLKITSLGEPKTGNGTLVNLTFKITYQPTYPKNVTSSLRLTGTELTDPSGPILHQVQNAEYWLYGSPPLKIDIATKKSSYYMSENVPIYGNLTRGTEPGPVSDGVVAIELEDPSNQTVLVRTPRTGSTTPNAQVEILAIVPCDSNGVPRSSFKRGTLAYFNTTMRNNDNVSLPLRLVITLFDGQNSPIGLTSIGLSPLAGTKLSWIISYPISSQAPFGTTYVYASALSNWLKLNGIPYGPEKSASFTISGSASPPPPSPPVTSNGPEGTFNITIRPPQQGSPPGIFKVNAASRNKGEDTRASITFQVKIPDPNGDGVVDIYDLIIVATAYGSQPGDIRWDIRADLIIDNVIDIYDLITVANLFGWSP